MSTETIPDWKLERYLLDELEPSDMAAIRQAAQDDAQVAQRIEALQASTRALLATMPPERFVASMDLHQTMGQRQNASRVVMWAGPAMAMAAAVILATQLWGPGTETVSTQTQVEVPETIRTKGHAPMAVEQKPATMTVFRRTTGGAVALGAGATASEGDVVQLAYSAGTQKHGALFSIDGRGVVTRHFPLTGGRSAPLDRGADTHLDDAYELDDAPHFERFFLVAADHAFDLAPVEAAIQRAGGEGAVAVDDLQVAHFRLDKVSP